MRADMNGFPPIPRAHPVWDRIDLLCTDERGAGNLAVGFPSACPVPPRIPPNWAVVAQIRTAAGGRGLTQNWPNSPESLWRAPEAPRPQPEPVSFWDQVVGIPLDVWIGCETTDALNAAKNARAQGDYLPPAPPAPPCDCDECFDWIDVTDLGSTTRTKIRGRRRTDAPH